MNPFAFLSQEDNIRSGQDCLARFSARRPGQGRVHVLLCVLSGMAVGVLASALFLRRGLDFVEGGLPSTLELVLHRTWWCCAAVCRAPWGNLCISAFSFQASVYMPCWAWVVLDLLYGWNKFRSWKNTWSSARTKTALAVHPGS